MSLEEVLIADLDDMMAVTDQMQEEIYPGNDNHAITNIDNAQEDDGDNDHLMDINYSETTSQNAATNLKKDKIKINLQTNESVKSIAKLKDSDKLKNIVEKINFYKNENRQEISGTLETDLEYLLIVEANNMIVEIENEINVIHKYLRDIYGKRFHELESLIPTPMDYIRTVKVLQNDIMERCKDVDTLQTFLTSAIIMILSVSASTAQGSNLNKDTELPWLNEACDLGIDLFNIKETILQYVESRMNFIAPNLTLIVGASVAAKLMGHAGGLTSLSKIPSCNFEILGQRKRTLGGMSNVGLHAHTKSYIYQCETVQKLPPDLRHKAMKACAAKAAIAARVDANHSSKDGQIGQSLVAEIEKKIDKWQEPPPVKKIKALPAPMDAPSKKRGGRKYRKMKERLGITELRKAANRKTFGSIEGDAYQSDIAQTVVGGGGILSGGGHSTGKIRGPIVDAKTTARISKTLAAKMHKQNQVYQQTYGGSTTVKRQIAGTASSIAFTPLQGLEIVNPQAQDKKIDEINNRYFSETLGFKRN